MNDFYKDYASFKSYQRPVLKSKHIRRFDRDFWQPMECRVDMSVLEVGCGTGLFLAYLKTKGLAEVLGIDQDKELASYIPEIAADHFRAGDIWEFLDKGVEGRTFDRIVMMDVLEHFSAVDGQNLLKGLSAILKPEGRILIKVPNLSSPWGLQHHFGDLTHMTGYTPVSMRQLALSAGLSCQGCYPHREGSPMRQFWDRVLHGLFARMLMTPPKIWTANFYAILSKAELKP